MNHNQSEEGTKRKKIEAFEMSAFGGFWGGRVSQDQSFLVDTQASYFIGDRLAKLITDTRP